MKVPQLLFLYCLVFSSFVRGATVLLVTEGTISQSAHTAYPFVEAGDVFRLTVSYSDTYADIDPDPNLGVYLTSDLSMVLEIIGKGVAFESIGGSVNVLARPDNYPGYTIISRAKPNGHSMFLVFSDLDRSHAPVLGDRIPIDFGTLGDYDSVGFSILHFRALDEPTPPPIPGTIPINPLDGEITSISIPEPGITSIVGVVLILAAMRTRQH
jgi:hypothetical protein